MQDRLKQAFDAVRAEEELKENTRAFLRGRMAPRPARTPARRLIPVAACLLLLLAGLGGYRAWFTSISVISIDINPSIELGVNRFDRVISVEGYNDEGEELALSLQVRNLNYEQALEQVLTSEELAVYLTGDQVVSITVVGEDETRNGEMLARVEACAAGHGRTYCCAVSAGAVEQAHHMGLSYGKYNACLEVWALDPDFPAQQLQSMTMREIRALIQSLSGGQAGGAGAGGGSGHGAGHGHGHGAGGS